TIVQFIIALGALVVTFASGQVFETSEAIINALTTQSPQFSYQIPGINNYDFGQISEPMAVLILFVGVLFFVDTIFWAGDVLTYRPLEPLLGRKESLNSHIDTMETELYQISPLDHKRDRLKYAVLTNDSSLRNMTSCLNYCYTVLAFGLGTFVYAGLVYVSG
ncbi:hypothetical protein ABNG03_19535, partial [Halorubrum sp. RMP-47]|uniref:hypothetical protein n=1 Tax=Halorubrum miltondacostae TaxID=3076378 RepID=UPI0035299A10